MTMLGLADKVGGNNGRVGRLVRDHGNLRRPGKDVDSNFAEQHALGLGDELVTRPSDDIGGLTGEQSIRQGSDCLNSTESHDHVRARHFHRIQHVRMHALTLERRGTGDDGSHARRFRRCDRHVSRSDMSVSSRWDIAACNIARDQLLTGPQTG